VPHNWRPLFLGDHLNVVEMLLLVQKAPWWHDQGVYQGMQDAKQHNKCWYQEADPLSRGVHSVGVHSLHSKQYLDGHLLYHTLCAASARISWALRRVPSLGVPSIAASSSMRAAPSTARTRVVVRPP